MSDEWYNQPMDDDWSGVSNLEGYDTEGNWTGTGSNGNSIFQNNYGDGGIPNTDDIYSGWDMQLPGYDNSGNWINDQNVSMGGQSIFGNPSSALTQQLPQQQGATQDFLGRLFSNPSLMAKGIGALFEGSQNKKMAKNLNSIANRTPFDPFGSQRPFYQQQLQSTVNDPYNQPMVKAQVDNIQRMQAIKDAAAGRRSNSLSSAPGVLAAQGQIAQQYMNSLMQPAGAGINPNSGGLAQLLSQGAKYDTNGAISPLLQVLGDYTRQEDLMKLLGKA
jgi:hypothetical protein